ncbi:MAG: quinolinate synthase NadA [Candidatus Omnitrophica bacterium]|nr:quinolinate synthase NadA [Candidatus Omnitrophota bacterium]
MDSVRTKLRELKKKHNAVILAHNYQLPEIQDVADFGGDSLGLSLEAAKTTADLIVFCGVYFMAETAKILSPEKTVIIPDKHAGCPMANMITAAQVRELKQRHPGAKVLCYVNSAAAVKAESDVCCTSANALAVARNAFSEQDEIIFIPDQYLAKYTASQLARKFIFWKGYCPTHARILPEHIQAQQRAHPDAEVLAHPECTPAVTALAAKVLSTGGMSRYVQQAAAKEFIIATEKEMVYRLSVDNPRKKFYAATDQAGCPNMKKITLDKLVRALETGREEVIVPAEILPKARRSIEAMLQYTV